MIRENTFGNAFYVILHGKLGITSPTKNLDVTVREGASVGEAALAFNFQVGLGTACVWQTLAFHNHWWVAWEVRGRVHWASIVFVYWRCQAVSPRRHPRRTFFVH